MTPVGEVEWFLCGFTVFVAAAYLVSVGLDAWQAREKAKR